MVCAFSCSIFPVHSLPPPPRRCVLIAIPFYDYSHNPENNRRSLCRLVLFHRLPAVCDSTQAYQLVNGIARRQLKPRIADLILVLRITHSEICLLASPSLPIPKRSRNVDTSRFLSTREEESELCGLVVLATITQRVPSCREAPRSPPVGERLEALLSGIHYHYGRRSEDTSGGRCTCVPVSRVGRRLSKGCDISQRGIITFISARLERNNDGVLNASWPS